MKSNIEGITEQNHLRLKNPIKRKRHPDEIKDRENYRCMKGISMPNYTINKGTLAENMATAAIEYPFALAETMGGNVSTARVLAIGPLKTLGMYRTWQEDWKNYSGEDWWKAQEINIGVPLAYRAIIFTRLGAETYKITKNPYISAGMAIALTITQDEMIDKATKSIKENTLNKDVEK